MKKELTRRVSGSRLTPKRMQVPMRNLPLETYIMEDKVEEENSEVPMLEVEGKCKLMAQKGVKPGFYAPQCDEQGNYRPLQCWHSTGYCWCVDKDGNEIPGTLSRETRDCGGEGRASVERNRERVARIRKLKEELHGETERQTETLKDPNLSGLSPSSVTAWSHLEYSTLLEQSRKLKEDHNRVIEEELLKMETELQEETAEGLKWEVLYLNRERRVLILQIEALRRESQQAEAGLEAQYKLHQQEMNRLREESLQLDSSPHPLRLDAQVFRTYRQVLEEQKRMAEGRYKSLVLGAAQDAVHLSYQNQQLTAHNTQLRKALAELKALDVPSKQ
ncbi:hypothetical protein P4O66_015245 [Electrophorus voltai]|uniref:Thyroglobulin type-1 domain-containing protein n=1 Tax=Electrophorus voltai TaxID=2609070 RepID=A0AAD8Z0G5_9TELE|nr:hypothetical protein P4O66_015245 [Electrophorus voltai]